MKRKPSNVSTALFALVAVSSIGCAASVLASLPRRPPLPNDAAITEAETLCAPPEELDAVEPCRPTRIRVEVCSSSEETGCDVRRGLHDFLGQLDAYDDYVVELRGEKVAPDPELEATP